MVRLECSRNSLECAFREEGVAVHLIKEFFTIHTSNFVKKIVLKVVRSVLAKPELDLELMPEKVTQQLQNEKPGKKITETMVNNVIKKRTEILMKLVNTVIQKFHQASEAFPPELCDFVKILKFNLRNEPMS